ncbi:hypothetical protein BGZ73_000168, partial [Actinomortierella ambigua]
TMENYQKRPKSKRSRFESDNDEQNAAQQHVEGKASTAGPAKGGEGGAAPSGNNSTKSASAANTHRHGVMHISAHGKIRTYVSRGLEVLLESEQAASASASTSTTSTIPSAAVSSPPLQKNYSGAVGVLTIKAQGKNIPKAVTIAEILKRKLEGSLHQFTEIGQVTEEEVWDPKAPTTTGPKQQQQQQQLDPIRLLRHRPTIRIRLSKHLDTHHPPREDEDSDVDEDAKEAMEKWPGAILDRDAAVRRLVGYQAPTGNDIYL